MKKSKHIVYGLSAVSHHEQRDCKHSSETFTINCGRKVSDGKASVKFLVQAVKGIMLSVHIYNVSACSMI